MQLIEIWETYLMQLDAEEDGTPFVPAGIQAASAGDEGAERPQTAESQDTQGSEAETATATAESEE